MNSPVPFRPIGINLCHNSNYTPTCAIFRLKLTEKLIFQWNTYIRLSSKEKYMFEKAVAFPCGLYSKRQIFQQLGFVKEVHYSGPFHQ